MTDDLAALLAAATPGPWAVEDETVIWTQINDPVETSYDIGYPLAETRRSKNIYRGSLWPTGQPEANAALIARAPDLAAEVLDLRAKLAEAEGALAKVSGALNDAFAAGAEEREGGSWRRQGMLSERYEAVRAESKDALAKIREGR